MFPCKKYFAYVTSSILVRFKVLTPCITRDPKNINCSFNIVQILNGIAKALGSCCVTTEGEEGYERGNIPRAGCFRSQQGSNGPAMVFIHCL